MTEELSTLEKNLVELEELEKERENKLPEFVLKSRKKNKWNWRMICASTALLTAEVLQTIFPTWPQQIKYSLTDKATETATERRIEQEFGINYWGNKNEGVLRIFESDLMKIRKQRPILLEHLNGITIHTTEDLDVWYTRPFLRFSARANPYTNNVEFIGLSHNNEVHEFAHIAQFNLPEGLVNEIREIHKDSIRNRISYVVSLFFNKESVWEDGKKGPKHGQVDPHGADAVEETIATYVEHLDDLNFWKHPNIVKDSRYVQTLEVLAKYGLATPKEVQDIKDTIDLYNPKFVSDIFLNELDKITPPKYLDGVYDEYTTEESYYESDNLKISYNRGMRSCSLYATVKSSSGKSASFGIEKESGKLKVSKSLSDASEFIPQQALDRLQELGYDKLFDWSERKKLKEVGK